LLLVLYVFINALIGKQFFYGDLLDEAGQAAPFRFTTIGQSMLAVTIVLTGENWNDIMHHTASNHGGWTCIFFI